MSPALLLGLRLALPLACPAGEHSAAIVLEVADELDSCAVGDLDLAPALLFTDLAGFHHAAAGELDGAPGLDPVVCGLAGPVLVFRFGP